MQDSHPALAEGLLEEAAPRNGRCSWKALALTLFSLSLSLSLAAALAPSSAPAAILQRLLGGAGGQHVATVADAVEVERVQPSVLAALASGRRIVQYMRTPRARAGVLRRSTAEVASGEPAAATQSGEERGAKKAAVLAALGAGSDAAVRAALATTLPALEASNPIASPTSSDVLEGKWAVKYTGAVAPGPVDSPTREIALLMYAAGFGPGAAALSLAKRLPDELVQVQTVSLEISRLESRAKMAVSLLQGSQLAEVELLSELVADGPAKLVETGMEVRINDNPAITVPPQVRYKRDLVVTYVDGGLLVVRDATGSPDILIRESSPPPEFAADAPAPEPVVAEVLPPAQD